MSITFVARTVLPTEWGTFDIFGFEDDETGKEHLALALGDLKSNSDSIMCRVHSECLTGDALGSLRCDCGSQLQYAMQSIGEVGSGLILYLRQEGRGIGLLNKLKAYALQDKGADTVEANVALGFSADERDYQVCEPILKFLEVAKVRLLTNNPKKVEALEALGVEVTEVLPVHTGENPHNEKYLSIKAEKMGHWR